ncbi:hypothetical protein ACHAQH_002849 [Verticillium albo-atrum]
MRLFTSAATLLSAVAVVHADDQVKTEFTAPQTSEPHDISAPIIFEWTLPQSFGDLDRMNITLHASVNQDGIRTTYAESIALDIDSWKLSYEWDPSNFTRRLDEDNATLLVGNHNRVFAEIRGDPNDQSIGWTTMEIEDLAFEGYHNMAPVESGTNVVSQSNWAAGAGILTLAMAVAAGML